MNIGDVVIPKEKNYLHCASQIYSHAICISVDPLILVSDSGDMRWSCLDQSRLIPLCRASTAIIDTAMTRKDS